MIRDGKIAEPVRGAVQARPALGARAGASLGQNAKALEKIAACCGCYSRQVLLLCHKKRGVRRQASSVRTDALFALDFRE